MRRCSQTEEINDNSQSASAATRRRHSSNMLTCFGEIARHQLKTKIGREHLRRKGMTLRPLGRGVSKKCLRGREELCQKLRLMAL